MRFPKYTLSCSTEDNSDNNYDVIAGIKNTSSIPSQHKQFLIASSYQPKSHCVLCNQYKAKYDGINNTCKNQYQYLHYGDIINDVMNQFHINVSTIINNMTLNN